VRPKFLDKELLKTPSLALERARFEIGHLGEVLQGMLAAKDEIHRLVDEALQHQVGELTAVEPSSLDAFRLEMEVADKFKRIYALSKRIARGELPEAVESRD
jgi:Na+/phosphate symporter